MRTSLGSTLSSVGRKIGSAPQADTNFGIRRNPIPNLQYFLNQVNRADAVRDRTVRRLKARYRFVVLSNKLGHAGVLRSFVLY